ATFSRDWSVDVCSSDLAWIQSEGGGLRTLFAGPGCPHPDGDVPLRPVHGAALDRDREEGAVGRRPLPERVPGVLVPRAERTQPWPAGPHVELAGRHGDSQPAPDRLPVRLLHNRKG